MAYLESISWTPHFEEIVALTLPGLKPPRPHFMGASQGHCVFKTSTHTHTHTHTLTLLQRTVDRKSTGTLQNVFADMIRRVHLCEERNGGHFQHFL
jgi:hypothetical protein